MQNTRSLTNQAYKISIDQNQIMHIHKLHSACYFARNDSVEGDWDANQEDKLLKVKMIWCSVQLLNHFKSILFN